MFLYVNHHHSCQEWRPQCIAVKYLIGTFKFPDTSLPDNVLRFNPIQVAEWLTELLGKNGFWGQRTLSCELGMSRTRIQQFLYLFRIPVDLRVRLKAMPELTEGELRPLTKMDGQRQRLVARQLLGV